MTAVLTKRQQGDTLSDKFSFGGSHAPLNMSH
jgi:hypothetical protein